MLSSLWQNAFGGGDDPSSTPTSPSSYDASNYADDEEEDDVDRLLTMFPEYGTHRTANGGPDSPSSRPGGAGSEGDVAAADEDQDDDDDGKVEREDGSLLSDPFLAGALMQPNRPAGGGNGGSAAMAVGGPSATGGRSGGSGSKNSASAESASPMSSSALWRHDEMDLWRSPPSMAPPSSAHGGKRSPRRPKASSRSAKPRLEGAEGGKDGRTVENAKDGDDWQGRQTTQRHQKFLSPYDEVSGFGTAKRMATAVVGSEENANTTNMVQSIHKSDATTSSVPAAGAAASSASSALSLPGLSRRRRRGWASSSSLGEDGNGDDADSDDGRQHWMPDRLCKHCYACEAPFTVFRRRHHCRLCGQVFCSSCSAYFVDFAAPGGSGAASLPDTASTRSSFRRSLSTSPPLEGTAATSGVSRSREGRSAMVEGRTPTGDVINKPGGSSATSDSRSRRQRVCKMCYEQVCASETKRAVVTRDTGAKPEGRRAVAALLSRHNSLENLPARVRRKKDSSGAATSAAQGSEAPRQSPAAQNGTAHRRSVSYNDGLFPSGSEPAARTPPITSSSIADQMVGFDGSGDKTSDFRVLSITKQKLDLERRKREDRERSEAEAMANRNGEPDRKPRSDACRPGGTLGRKLVKRLVRNGQGTAEGSCDDGGEEEVIVATSAAGGDAIEVTAVEDTDEGNESGRLNSSQQRGGLAIAATAATQVSSGDSNQQGEEVDATTIASRRLGLVAADHLEKLGRDLLESDAPSLLEELKDGCRQVSTSDFAELLTSWVDTLMTLATRCCATVEPNVKRGDLLDIRPYCKIKVIPGGSVKDCIYMSGVIFHKNVSHKSMARELSDPKIMLLSGGIEYTRRENHIASLDTLLEQEDKYMEILVTKIIKLKPDVLLVGRSVSRKAQELLLRSNIVLIQHVKSALMGRIARQTGATILSSTDHVMNQFGATVLGQCRRFRLVTFRDNDTWMDQSLNGTQGKLSLAGAPPKDSVEKDDVFDTDHAKVIKSAQRNIPSLLADTSLKNYERQAVLAAKMLGENVLDGTEAVRSGLAKRGVANTYAMIEGCPKDLGCTVVLRGATRPALKQVKRVLRFLVNVAYNLKLETSYLRERCAMIPPSYKLPSEHSCSSSLCVNFGQPPNPNRKIRPWNGGKGEASQRSLSGKITAFDHQAILITSIWMTDKTQCCPAEVKGICYYSMQDVSLGQFLRDSCFNLSLKCQNQSCKKSVIDHSLSFVHNDGLIKITVEHMEDQLPPVPLEKASSARNSSSDGKEKSSSESKESDSPIATWTYCRNCSKVVTPLVFISEDTWKWSFGKFLETFFYNKDAILNTENSCSCQMQSASMLYFGCGNLAARFTYEKVAPFTVFCRRHLPFDDAFHHTNAIRELEHISVTSSAMFVKFDKHIERISREARELFGCAVLQAEHLQTVVSELNLLLTEVDHAAKTLQEKIASMTDQFHKSTPMKLDDRVHDALYNFPWHSRRYLFMLASAWNERLSAAGQAVGSMKKLAGSSQLSSGTGRSDTNVVPTIVGEGAADDINEGMKRLLQLQEAYSKNYSVNAPGGLLHGPSLSVDRQSAETDIHQGHRISESEYHDVEDDAGDDDGFDSDTDIDFEEDVDADVLASRRRAHNARQSDPPSARRQSKKTSSQPLHRRSTGQRRQQDSFDATPNSRLRHQGSPLPPPRAQRRRSSSSQFSNTTSLGYYDGAGSQDSTQRLAPSQQSKSKTVTAGGAVKSAITRFFNRGMSKEDPYVVDLGMFSEGRLRLEPGVFGVVVPVYDDKPSTVIAHSLSSIEYDLQFKHFSQPDEGSTTDTAAAPQANTASNDRSIDDMFGSNPNAAEAVRQGRNERNPQRHGSDHSKAPSGSNFAAERKDIERRLLVRDKTHIKHTFRDIDGKGQHQCKFVCTTYWATQFHAVRQAFMTSAAANGKDSSSSAETLKGSASANSDRSKADVETSYVRSLAASHPWAVSGGKSGASFSRTADDRFVIKCISRTELQMFLDCAPAYFEYLSKAFFHGLPTVLCKIVGVYQIGYHNRVTGKRTMEQVAVMQNIFYGRNISKVFDLKGSLRGRIARQSGTEKEKAPAESAEAEKQTAQQSLKPSLQNKKSSAQNDDESHTLSCDESTDTKSSSDFDDDDESSESSDHSDRDDRPGHTDIAMRQIISAGTDHGVKHDSSEKEPSIHTLLDGDFLEFTAGRPLPLTDRAKAVFHMSILNDTLFLSIINVLDYSILVGIDEEKKELVVGIIDYMRQYDILKQMERVGKSLPMVVGSEAPTIIQPPLYKARFTNAMERYFMTVPNKWTTI